MSCQQCPHKVGDTYQRDCAFPDCLTSVEILAMIEENIRLKTEIANLKSKAVDKEKLLGFMRNSRYRPKQKYDDVDMIIRAIVNNNFVQGMPLIRNQEEDLK